MYALQKYQRNDGIMAVKPEARCAVSVRQAVAGDLAFIDQLQKMHTHMVGWMPTKQLEKLIADGHVVIAEETGNGQLAMGNGGTRGGALGYCIAKDQYMKRDDVGIVYQLNVLPLKQRHLVGASLIKAVFERAAYGCRLFCCWCAQDIQANYFWESIGFVPLAFRTGSRAKQRIHIFWQRRVRENDEMTPYWFPSQTSNGAVAEDRIVLPIPPDTHWRDAKPVVLPGMERNGSAELGDGGAELPKALPGGALVKPRPEQTMVAKPSRAQIAAVARSKSKHLGGVPAGKAAVITRGGVKYIDRADAPAEEEVEQLKPKRTRPKKPRMKNDPKFITAARELRDRFLEEVNCDAAGLLPPGAYGKYDVSRQLGQSKHTAAAASGDGEVIDAEVVEGEVVERKLLDAA